jgi:hypothetical protein
MHALFDRGIGQSDQDRFRHRGEGDIDLNIDRDRIDSQQRKRLQARQHCPMPPGIAPHVCAARVPQSIDGHSFRQ